MNFDDFVADLTSVLTWRTSPTPLEEILKVVPRVQDLDMPPGTIVIVRADLDVPLEQGQVSDRSRIEASLPTVRQCIERQWVTVLVGHIGRNPQQSLKAVAAAYGQALGQDVLLVEEWLVEERIAPGFQAELARAAPGQVLMADNVRKYPIERILWDVDGQPTEAVSREVFDTASSLAAVASVEVNEAIAASNPDFSSTVLPLLMQRVAMGTYLSSELNDHVRVARDADLVVFSGLKANKLDDLEAIIRLGRVRIVIAAGALAGSLLKAVRPDLHLGSAETDPTYVGYLSQDRLAQGRRIVQLCAEASTELVLPVDFVLDDGSVSTGGIPAGRQQLDVGPESSALFRRVVQDYARAAKPTAGQTGVAFYNGVFGKFEDDMFAEGTRQFIGLLAYMTSQGIRTYVGGGEGRKALLQYGQESDVTHAFTAGGTILKILGGRGIPYLEALVTSAKRRVPEGL